MFSIKKFSHSLSYAAKGFRFVFQHEQNFRIQLVMSVVVIVAMLYFHISGTQAVLLVLSMALVLILEVINSVFEQLVDLLKPRLHYVVGEIKNMMAAAVLLASLAAAVVGGVIFWPYALGIIQRISL